MASILVITESRGGTLRGESFELLAAARRLAQVYGDEVVALVAGHAVAAAADAFAARGCSRVLLADDSVLADYSLDVYCAVVDAAVRVCDPRFVVMSATPCGWDLAPRLAARLDAGFIGSVVGLDVGDGRAAFTRRVFGGKLTTAVVSLAPRTVLTVEAGAFDRAESGGAEGSVEPLAFDPPPSPRTRFVARREGDGGDVDLTKADVIVSGGRGVGDAGKFAEVIEPLADALGAAVGASRPVVDAGWLPRAHQVGSSGQVVAPKLYIACGISGAVQHLAGMKNSRYIVAVNRDARAPIFQVADLGVVGDVHDILPALIAALKDRC